MGLKDHRVRCVRANARDEINRRGETEKRKRTRRSGTVDSASFIGREDRMASQFQITVPDLLLQAYSRIQSHGRQKVVAIDSATFRTVSGWAPLPAGLSATGNQEAAACAVVRIGMLARRVRQFDPGESSIVC